MKNKCQEALDFLNTRCNVANRKNHFKRKEAVATLQELIDKLGEIYKYVPDIDNLVKWCKADKLQAIGKEIIEEGLSMKCEVIENEK